jgi:pimeloyl-ACP methyl ester carboxylesterase
MSQQVVIERGTARLLGEYWPGQGPVTVLLHAGVADSRSWQEVVPRLAGSTALVAYDRRGFGQSAPSTEPFTHVEDLLAVLDQLGVSQAWLVGSSAGGGIALDTALTTPERVAGLILLAPAVSGAPDADLDPATLRLAALIEQATASGDLDQINRLETWVWLDGPGAPEGRVGGPARSLALAMNAICLRNAVPEGAGGSGLDAWARLAEIEVPAMVACGDQDVPVLVTRSRELASRLPRGQYRELAGLAHLPYLEQPAAIAELIAGALPAH